ncbi:MAG: DsbA family protein [Alphaproteobacteria bacterium]
MSHTVEFFYGIGSRYSYLAATRIAALKAETGCTVRWRPIRSADLIVANGADPFDGGEVSGQYGWPYRRHDAENWAEYYGVPYLEPDFDNYDPRDLARACGAADRMGAIATFSHGLFRAVFVDGGKIGRARLVSIAETAELDIGVFNQTLDDPTIDDDMAATLAEAHRRGVFGVPTFFVGEHMFWGNDRMVLLHHFLLQD